MDEEIERLVISVRADTAAFARDVSAMRGELEGPLAGGASRAGRMIEGAFSKAIASGKFGFDDLRRVALSALSEIATASLRSLVQGGGSGGGAGSAITSAAATLLGFPGRATGGPVSQGRPYLVGERGPEVFVPGGHGRIENIGRPARDVRVSIAVHAPNGTEPQALRQSSRQLARAVRAAVGAER